MTVHYAEVLSAHICGTGFEFTQYCISRTGLVENNFKNKCQNFRNIIIILFKIRLGKKKWKHSQN
jgi:hypothetical protein